MEALCWSLAGEEGGSGGEVWEGGVKVEVEESVAQW